MRRVQVRWLFIVPAVCAAFTPLYARTSPELGPIPFLIWFQFATVVLGSLVVGIVYLVEARGSDPAATEPGEAEPGCAPADAALSGVPGPPA